MNYKIDGKPDSFEDVGLDSASFFCRLKCDTWFYYAYDQIEDNSKFSDVRQRVENIYANTYLQKITPK